MNVNTNIFINNSNLQDSILYVADIPRETAEDDILSFFKDYPITQAKIFQYFYPYLVKLHIHMLIVTSRMRHGV
jgi:hypothetical protein